jgi:hypothetical protein
MGPDPSWAGRVTFVELLSGAPLAYAFLVVLWERVLRAPRPEWQYLLVHREPRGWLWKLAAVAGGVTFTIAFSQFEMLARNGIARGIHEFWFLLAAFVGMLWLILWRGRRVG